MASTPLTWGMKAPLKLRRLFIQESDGSNGVSLHHRVLLWITKR